MGEFKGTPGEWWLTERAGHYEILAKDTECDWYGHHCAHAVAYADTEIDEPAQRANAHLIAAAPDLLAALQGLLGIIKDDAVLDSHEAGEAFAALAKALGQEAGK